MLLCYILQLNAQNTITLTFSAIQNGLHQPLDSINIENLTQGGDTMLHAPDTVLELTDISSIHDMNSVDHAGLWLNPVYPGYGGAPLQVRLSLAKPEQVTLRLYDVAGREHAALTERLMAGEHCFHVHAGVETLLILSAETSHQHSICKIVCVGQKNEGCRLVFAGSKGNSVLGKSQKTIFPWLPGDHLRYTGFVSGLSDTIIDNPSQSTTYAFQIPYSFCPPTVTDTNGTIYNTVQIGYQCWLRENLRVRHYNTGIGIPNVTLDNSWQLLTTGAMCWYNNDSATYYAIYGALYNWHAVNSGQLCPKGWHVPSDDEVKTMEMYLGMTQAQADSFGWHGTDEGGRLKEAGTAHWNPPNMGATNATGLTVLPGGCRFGNGGYFNHIGNYGYLWTATFYSAPDAWIREFSYNSQRINRIYPFKTFGFSVRCIKDS